MAPKVKGDRVVLSGGRVGTVISVDRDGGVVLFDAVRGSREQDFLMLTVEELGEAPYEPAQLNELFAAVDQLG